MTLLKKIIYQPGIGHLILLTLFAIFSANYLVNSFVEPIRFNGVQIAKALYAPGVVEKSQVDVHHQQVTLPHGTENETLHTVSSTYLLKMQLNDTKKQVLAFTKLHDSAKIWLNGVMVKEVGQIAVAESFVVPRNRHWPTYVSLPEQLLIKGDNQLLIQVASNQAAILAPVYIGAYKNIVPDINALVYKRKYSILIGIACAVPFGFFMFLVWLNHKDRKVYLWLSLALLSWPANTVYILNSEQGLPWVVQYLCEGISNTLYATSFACFTLAYANIGLRLVKYLWLISFIVLSGYGYLGWSQPEEDYFIIENIFYAWIGLVACSGSFTITYAAIKYRNWRSMLLATTGIFTVILTVWDVLALADLVSTPVLTVTPQYAVISILFIYCGVISYELALALKLSDTFNEKLSQEVELKSSRLNEQYQRIVQLEKQKTLSSERSRLITDMHDGTSGQLTSIIAGLRAKKLSTDECIAQLEYCLKDLRLILDSMNEQATTDLASAFALFRQRVEPLIQAANIAPKWHTHSIPDELSFEPKFLLNVYRILQEAITNVIKHAQASELAIIAIIKGEKVQLTIKDNGKGYNLEQSLGYGMHNMKIRAGEISADLDIINNNGTTIQVLLPMTKGC